MIPGDTPRAAHTEPADAPLFTPGFFLPFVLITALFFLWGIPNNLNDVLIRQFMKSFAITRLEAGLVQSAFYLGYFLLALPAALLMQKLGYKAGFITGLLLFGGGTFLFWPAALIGKYYAFLLALFIMASGLAFLETASNTFIALAGPPETSERRVNFAQAFNPLGAISGALLGTVFIFSGVELKPARVLELKLSNQYDAYLRFEKLRVVTPYIVLGVVALIWVLLIWRTRFPVLRDESASLDSPADSILRLLRNRHLLFSMVAQFFYVGSQVGTWSYFIQYVQDYAGQSEKVGGYFLTGTLVMFGIGRFTSAYLMKWIDPARLMGTYCVVNIVLLIAGVAHPGWIGIWAIFLTSFFMSLMFPTIFALGVRGLGSDSKIGGSLIIMAILGGAVLTPVMGVVADTTHKLALSYAVPLVGFAIIGMYSFTSRSRAGAA